MTRDVVIAIFDILTLDRKSLSVVGKVEEQQPYLLLREVAEREGPMHLT